MPAVLEPDAWPHWLDPQVNDTGLLGDLLHPAEDDLLELVQVSPRVNSPHNEGPELVMPYVAPEPTAPATAPATQEELPLFPRAPG